MTYVIAWKSDSEIFLSADTALTSLSDDKTLQITESSFGQPHVLSEDEENMVEERVVKLFLRENIGVAFAGSYSLAIRVVTSFYEKIEKGKAPKVSLEEAIFDNRFPPGKTIQLVVAYYDSGPHIISFNVNHDLKINEEEQIVQIGNPLHIHKKLSEIWIKDIYLKTKTKPVFNLVALLSIFQSYNLFSPQMERGIGGAFCGLFIDASGGRWQPDILYIEYGGLREKHVATLFRYDCLVVSSPVIGQSRCLCSFLPPQTQKFMLQQSIKAIKDGKELQQTLKYDYLVVIGVENLTVVVIEMKKKLKHALIWLESFKDENGFGTKVLVFPKLKKILSDEGGGLSLVSFVPPNIPSVPEDRIKRRIIKYD